MRVAHVIAEYSAKEAMGRTIAETVGHVPAEHHLVAAHVHDGAERFASATATGGAMETFPVGRGEALARVLARIRPDVVHVHGGALAPLLAAGSPIREHPNVLTMYAWPRVPPVRQLRAGGIGPAWRSNVLRPRVAATTVLPRAAVRAALRRAGTSAVLTPDPAVRDRLRGMPGIPVHRLTSGAPMDARRASFDPEKPVIVFAGRAEGVRGVTTLIDAFPTVLDHVPGARLRLLLIPRPDLPAIVARAEVSTAADRIEVVTDPVEDLLAELAAAQVGAWPFQFDYTTSPPAMAVAEAMAVGLPVVATDVRCVRSVLEPEVNGLAVQPGDAQGLASAILRLLTDRTEWERYAQAGPVSMEQFSWARAAEATAAAYASALR